MQAGRRYAIAQRDVRAVLRGAIAHPFAAPGSGTPQWTWGPGRLLPAGHDRRLPYQDHVFLRG